LILNPWAVQIDIWLKIYPMSKPGGIGSGYSLLEGVPAYDDPAAKGLELPDKGF